MTKPDHEFTSLEHFPLKSLSPGISERVLAHDPETGDVSRVLYWEPGTETADVLTHDFWEESVILQGSLYDAGRESLYTAGMYACRPPGMQHGPWRSEEGCVMFEFRYRRDGGPSA